MAEQLQSEEATISEDVEDFLDENAVKDLGERLKDLDLANKRIEDLRTRYRSIHNRLKISLGDQPYKDSYEDSFKFRIAQIKDYIVELKRARRSIISKDDKSREIALEVKSVEFSYLYSSIVYFNFSISVSLQKSDHCTHSFSFFRKGRAPTFMIKKNSNLDQLICDNYFKFTNHLSSYFLQSLKVLLLSL